MRHTITLLTLSVFLSFSAHAQVDTTVTNALFQQASNAFQAGEFERCVILTDSLANTWLRGGNRMMYATMTFYNIWTHLNELKDYAKAEMYAERALHTIDTYLDGEHPVKSDLYSALAGLQSTFGRFERAKDYAQRAIQYCIDLGQQGEFSDLVAHSGMGDVYLEFGQWEDALTYFEHCIVLFQGLVDENGLDAQFISNAPALYAKIASIHLELNNLEAAAQASAEGIKYVNMSDRKDYFGFHEIYRLSAKVKAAQKQYDEAITILNKVDSIYQSFFGPKSIQNSIIHKEKGIVFQSKGDYKQALSENNTAIEILGGTLAEDGIGLLEDNADLYCQGCEPALFQQRLSILEDMVQNADQDEEIALLHTLLATAHLATQSILLVRKGIHIKQGSKKVWYQQFQSIFQSGVYAASRLYQSTEDPLYAEQGFLMAEGMKAAVLQESLASSEAQESMLPSALKNREQALSLDIIQNELLLEQIQDDSDATPEEKTRAQKEVLNSRLTLENFIDSLVKAYPNYVSTLNIIQENQLPAIQKSLQENEGLISYLVQPDKEVVQVFLVRRNSLELTTLPWSVSLDADIQKFARLLPQKSLVQKRKKDQFRSLGYGLYTQLIRPLESFLEGTDHLIILPANTLYYLPFEVLLTQKGESDDLSALPYLLRNKTISYHYSGSLFLNSRKKFAWETGGLMAFAPVFSQESNISMVSRERTMVLPNLAAITDDRWQPLPYTEREVRHVAALFEEKDVTLLLGEEATETALKKALQTPHRFLHFATHSFVNLNAPHFSGLVCLPDESSGLNDRILYASEIDLQRIKAQLVVLSSCESGVGPLVSGEGMQGLNRSFLAAGVPNVLFSLWKVDDRSTSLLMETFYKQVKAGASFPEALREAKLTLLNTGKTSLPVYWSAFQIVGG